MHQPHALNAFLAAQTFSPLFDTSHRYMDSYRQTGVWQQTYALIT